MLHNIKIEVIQGGLRMEGSEYSLPPIIHETTKASGILHTDGVISMARLEPGSASSEFFICINDKPAGQELEYTSGQMLSEPVVIHKVYRLEGR